MIFEALNALYYKRLFSEEELKQISEALEAYSFTLYPLRGINKPQGSRWI
jgi:peptidoglycan biosynthesis protein MviN/MurJ (putative lipid II flippase)